MSPSPSIIGAASTLAEWARERRRTWTDAPPDVPVRKPAKRALTPMPAPEPVMPPLPRPEPSMPPIPHVAHFEPHFEPASEPDIESPIEWDIQTDIQTEVGDDAVAAPTFTLLGIDPSVEKGPSAVTRALAFVKACTRTAAGGLGEFVVVALDHLEVLRDSAVLWLVRGVALVAVVAVVTLIVSNRDRLFARWDRVASMVVTAANRPPMPPPVPVKPIASGMGRVTINATNGAAAVFVDGTLRGPAPVTLDLPVGAHRVVLKGENGSVEKVVRLTAGDALHMDEAIYAGWVAVTTPIELSLSEDGHPLKRDERGWAILPPGPHDIHLDNATLGVHEVRHVLVMPGDTTRLSYSPHTSTISLTANEPAEVWIDGTSYGQAPLSEKSISIGVHDVRVRSAAHARGLRGRAR